MDLEARPPSRPTLSSPIHCLTRNVWNKAERLCKKPTRSLQLNTTLWKMTTDLLARCYDISSLWCQIAILYKQIPTNSVWTISHQYCTLSGPSYHKSTKAFCKIPWPTLSITKLTLNESAKKKKKVEWKLIFILASFIYFYKNMFIYYKLYIYLQ